MGRALQALRAELHTLRGQFQPETAAVFVVAGLALCVYRYYGSDDFFNAHLTHLLPWQNEELGYARCLYWCYSPFITLVVLPGLALAAVRGVLRLGRGPESGWRPGNWRLGGAACLVFYAVVLVLVAYASRTGDFRNAYPLCREARHSLPRLVLYEASFAVYFVAWESFFRGFLTLGLERTFGPWAAFVQMLPFVVIHFDKPVLEAMSSVFGGVALGYLALRTRSFLYGAFIHAAMAITLDAFVMASTGFH